MAEHRISDRQWLLDNNMAPYLNDLVQGMLSDRPEDVDDYVLQWVNRRRESREDAKDDDLVDGEIGGDDEEEPGTQIPDGSAAISPVALRSRFPHPSGRVSLDLDTPHVKGHYGTVYRGMRLVGAEAARSKSDSGAAAAVKVVPVEKDWVLDEYDHLQSLQKHLEGAGDPLCSHITYCEGCYYDDAEHSLWIVFSEWLPVTLGSVIRARRRLKEKESEENDNDDSTSAVTSETEIRSVVQHALIGLKWGLDSGLVHLDIKPDNLLLRLPASLPATSVLKIEAAAIADVDEGEADALDHVLATLDLSTCEVVVADWGTSQSLTAECQQLGDFNYMAPEIFFEKPKDFTAGSHDVWSIGCLMIFLAEGYPPWEDASDEATFDFVERNYICPMVQHPTQWSREFIHFLSLCFERDAQLRPTAAALLAHEFISDD